LEKVVARSQEYLELHIDRLIRYPLPIQRRLIRAALRQWQGHVRRIGADHLELLVQDLVPGKAGRSVNLPAGLQVRRTPMALCFKYVANPRSPDRADWNVPYKYTVDADHALPMQINIPESGYRLSFTCEVPPSRKEITTLPVNTIMLDSARLIYPLTIRNFRPGDRISPFGMTGSQKLKDFFINLKLPVEQRGRVPLLLSGEEIVWVVGLRRGNQALVDKTTTKILRIEAQKMEI